MIIVAGSLTVAPDQREEYLRGCDEVTRAARAAPGCLDFHLSADRLDAGRINVFERWETVAAVEAFRGSGPSDGQAVAIIDAAVDQHEVASSQRL